MFKTGFCLETIITLQHSKSSLSNIATKRKYTPSLSQENTLTVGDENVYPKQAWILSGVFSSHPSCTEQSRLGARLTSNAVWPLDGTRDTRLPNNLNKKSTFEKLHLHHLNWTQDLFLLSSSKSVTEFSWLHGHEQYDCFSLYNWFYTCWSLSWHSCSPDKKKYAFTLCRNVVTLKASEQSTGMQPGHWLHHWPAPGASQAGT